MFVDTPINFHNIGHFFSTILATKIPKGDLTPQTSLLELNSFLMTYLNVCLKVADGMYVNENINIHT